MEVAIAFAVAGFIFGERPQKTTITPSAPILSLPKTEVVAELRNRTEIELWAPQQREDGLVDSPEKGRINSEEGGWSACMTGTRDYSEMKDEIILADL